MRHILAPDPVLKTVQRNILHHVLEGLFAVESVQIDVGFGAIVAGLQFAHGEQVESHHMAFHEFIRAGQGKFHFAVHQVLQGVGRLEA